MVHGICAGLHIPAGMPTLGGPLASSVDGLTFYVGSQHDYLRAFDTATGKEVRK